MVISIADSLRYSKQTRLQYLSYGVSDVIRRNVVKLSGKFCLGFCLHKRNSKCHKQTLKHPSNFLRKCYLFAKRVTNQFEVCWLTYLSNMLTPKRLYSHPFFGRNEVPLEKVSLIVCLGLKLCKKKLSGSSQKQYKNPCQAAAE